MFADTEEEATPNAIMSRRNEAVILKPTYTKQNVTCTVTVNYEGVERTADVYSNCEKGKELELTAPEIDGKQFFCWKDASGNILGYRDYFRLPIISDTAITASYVEENTAVDRKPVITLCAPYTVTTDNEKKVTCGAVRNVPEGYTVVEAGILFAKNSTLTQEEFIYGAGGIEMNASGNFKSYGTDLENVAVNSEDETVSFRGYLIVRNDETNITEEPYYTDLVVVSYSGLNA